MNTDNKGKISYVLLAINIVPLLFFGIIILLLGNHWFTRAMHAEVETELSYVSSNLITTFDALYPGDYRLVGEDAYQLFKGGHNLTTDYTVIDRVKEDTGLEVSLFYQDTRILTTITESSNRRIIGSGAPTVVSREVLSTGTPHFYNKTIIYGRSYFSYYVPLFNQDGTVIGMFAVCKPSGDVDAAIQSSIRPLFIADILLLLLTSLITFFYMNRFSSDLLQIHSFLKEVSAGNLSASLSSSILSRGDELGEIAHSALNMQHSLHVLVEQDALTFLYNRRFGENRLKQIVAECHEKGIPFCIAIGDIDYFKSINDSYGHTCGDAVLKNVAGCLKNHMQDKGFVARWGGEEFLFVYENRDLESAHAALEELISDIRQLITPYDGAQIKITMTFGLVAGYHQDVSQLLTDADRKLYEGKTNGRNQVVV